MNEEMAGGSACLLQKRKISIVINFCLFCCLAVQQGAISFRFACAYKFFSIPFERGSLHKQFSVFDLSLSYY